MTYIDNTDMDRVPVDQCDVPNDGCAYIGTFASDTELHFTLPVDCKVCTVTNGTTVPLEVYVSRTNGVADNLGTSLGNINLFTGGNRRIVTIPAGGFYPFAQSARLNRVHCKGSSTSGLITMAPGYMMANGLAAIETQAIAGTAF